MISERELTAIRRGCDLYFSVDDMLSFKPATDHMLMFNRMAAYIQIGMKWDWNNDTPSSS